MDIEIRRATILDLSEIQSLFINSIKKSCYKDYNSIEIEVWCESVNNKERWEDAIKEQYFIKACFEGKVVGFASLKNTPFKKGYLDFIYVHPDCQKMGVARELVEKIELEAILQKLEVLESDVSITALPFFQKQGYFKVRKNLNRKGKGVDLINYRMTKNL